MREERVNSTVNKESYLIRLHDCPTVSKKPLKLVSIRRKSQAHREKFFVSLFKEMRARFSPDGN